MRRIVIASVCIAVLALVRATAAQAKPAAVKWSQFLDGSLVAVFQLKRGSSELCTGETASVEDNGFRLVYKMTCSGEPYELNVLMPQAVIPERTAVKRVRAEAHVTLHKEDPGVWWSSLARHPEMFKTLVQRDTQRGDLEPDEDELAEASSRVRAQRGGAQTMPQQATVDAATGGAAAVAGTRGHKAQQEQEQQAMRQAKLDEDISEALAVVSEEVQGDLA